MAASILPYALLTSSRTAIANRETFASKHSCTNWRRNKHAKQNKTKQNKTKKLQKRSDRTDSQLAVRKCKNGACNGKPRRGGRENTTLFSDSHTLRTRLSRVHENWPRLEGNADNHVQYVTSANAMRVLCFNFK